eukprot:g20887.t1
MREAEPDRVTVLKPLKEPMTCSMAQADAKHQFEVKEFCQVCVTLTSKTGAVHSEWRSFVLIPGLNVPHLACGGETVCYDWGGRIDPSFFEVMRVDEAFSATPDPAAKPTVKATEIPSKTTSTTTSTSSAAPAAAAAPLAQSMSEAEVRAALKEAVTTNRFSLIGRGAPTPDLGAKEVPVPTDEPPGAPGLDSTSTTTTTAENGFDPDDFDLLGASFDTPAEVATPPESPLPEVKPDEKAVVFCATTGQVHLPWKGFSVAGDFDTPPDLSIGGVHLFSADRVASAIEGFRPPMSTSNFLMLESVRADPDFFERIVLLCGR